MAYKFQKGTANLSGSIKLDSGYDLLSAGSNDLGTSAANFAVGYGKRGRDRYYNNWYIY